MDMTLRWYGPGYDSVTLKQIRQIPGVKNVITTLFGKQAGERWLPEEIAELKRIVEDAGLGIAGIESVNVSDDIKIGTAKADEHIDNYIKTLQALGEADIHVVCYNFMPVFDWTRSELARERADGSTVLAYNQDTVDMIDPEHMKESVAKMSNGFVMPGWEPERLDRLKELFEMYKDVDAEKLFNNLVYFLEAIGPVCEKYDIKMGIHPDDPAWPIFGLPRIMTGVILAAGRGFGEAAVLLYTTGSGTNIRWSNWDLSSSTCPLNPFRSAETLSLQIWDLQVNGQDQNLANLASAVLLILVLAFSIGANILSNKINKKNAGEKA